MEEYIELDKHMENGCDLPSLVTRMSPSNIYPSGFILFGDYDKSWVSGSLYEAAESQTLIESTWELLWSILDNSNVVSI